MQAKSFALTSLSSADLVNFAALRHEIRSAIGACRNEARPLRVGSDFVYPRIEGRSTPAWFFVQVDVEFVGFLAVAGASTLM